VNHTGNKEGSIMK